MYTTIEACKILRKGRTKLQELMNEGLIGFHRDGGKILISEEQIQEYWRSIEVKPHDQALFSSKIKEI